MIPSQWDVPWGHDITHEERTTGMTIKRAGLALMVGVVLVWVAGLFLPGFALIDPTDQTDFAAARDALGDSAVLAHWMNFLTLIALLLMIFAFVRLYPVASRKAGVGGRLLQFGIITSIIEWSILIIVVGMRHFEIHLMQRSTSASGGSQSPEAFEAAALALHIDMTGVILATVALYPLASIMVGLGLAKQFASLDLYKGAAYAMAAAGALGLVNFLVGMNAPDADLQTLVTINSIALYAAGACLLIVGLGMYQGRQEFADEGSTASSV